MCRFPIIGLAILLGLFGSPNFAFAQNQPAQPHSMTFAEANAIVNALHRSHASYGFSASGTVDGRPWAISAWGFSGSSGGGAAPMVRFPYYYVPVYYYPTVEAPQDSVPSPGARPQWLDSEPPREPVTPSVPRRPRHVSKADRAKAEMSLAQGDESFARQKYSAAVQRYSSAARLAPDWADPHFRRGFALVAMGNYSKAVISFREGLKLRSDWRNSPFHLDSIYAAGELERANQAITQHLNSDPLDHDVLFVQGMQLFFAGDQQKSAIYLAQAASLETNESGLLQAFLESLDAPANRE